MKHGNESESALTLEIHIASFLIMHFNALLLCCMLSVLQFNTIAQTPRSAVRLLNHVSCTLCSIWIGGPLAVHSVTAWDTPHAERNAY